MEDIVILDEQEQESPKQKKQESQKKVSEKKDFMTQLNDFVA